MTRYYTLHPDNPQQRVIYQISEELKKGALIAYPTDSSYAFGCTLDNRKAVETIRRIRNLDSKHPLTLICGNIGQAAEYAQIDNYAFNYLKQVTPGAYTFILPASKIVPKTVIGAKRKLVGIRIPDNAIAHAIVEQLGEPFLSSTLLLPGSDLPIHDPHEIIETPAKCVDIIVDGGFSSQQLTSIIEIIGKETNIIRGGAGDLSLFQV